MQQKEKNPVDVAALSKKYKCDVKKIIRAWKNEKGDYELTKVLGINMLKLMQIRQEIATAYEKKRQKNLQKSFSTKSSFLFKP
ncbi:MAG: hypothetical protein PHX01_07045 [Clostridia bacterium]|nr:hypothetical protein [Clostridia bacterium]